MSDIICCLDESISTRGDPAAWGKAVALTLLEIATDSDRSFALIHFAEDRDFKEELHQAQVARRFTVTGVLLDKGNPGLDFNLKAFCQDIYRTSQRKLVTKRVGTCQTACMRAKNMLKFSAR